MQIKPGVLHGFGLVALIALGAGAATAQSVDCDDAVTQGQINACFAVMLEEADDDLNAAYSEARQVMRDIDSDLPKGEAGAEMALRNAQRAWINFRDAACLAEGFQMRGGSAEAMLVLSCQVRLTQTRAEELWMLAAGQEG